jgi:phosphate transport system protein
MADRTQEQLRRVLDAFVTCDERAAEGVCAADVEIDEINRDIFRQTRDAIMREPAMFEPLLQVMHISRHLERIADHATNIAEDLIYLIEGRIVRHNPGGQVVTAGAGADTACRDPTEGVA